MKRVAATSIRQLSLLCLLLVACDRIDIGDSEPNLYPDLVVAGGYLFGFTSKTEFNFVAVSFASATVSQLAAQLALPEDERGMHLNGPLGRGDGGHNLEWNWHFLPGEWALAEASIELCDGNPQYISENLDYYIDTVGRYCPWGAHVIKQLE